MTFPDTKYMGSKQAILPFILSHIQTLDFDSALDAFSGSGCVAYGIKSLGKRVVTNDFHAFAYHTAKATVENNKVVLSADDVGRLTAGNAHAPSFIQDTFKGLYFSPEDNRFLDETYHNIRSFRCEFKRSLALAALCRACMKKRPRGIFTFVGNKGGDGRRDLKISMRQQFIEAVATLNAAVFNNGRVNRAIQNDVFAVSGRGIDLVYIDPPYVSGHSDCDYTRRYHFIEGLCTYWKGLPLQHETLTKKISSYATAFKSRATIHEALRRLFEHFQRSILVVSYGSNGIPCRDEMVDLLKLYKRRVRVKLTSHKYCHGNHNHKVGQNNNDVSEYLFIAS